MSDTAVAELEPLTNMITRLFGREFVQFVIEKYGSLRKFYETSTPTTQCKNVIGKLEPNKTDCWICGFKILNVGHQYDAFAPECEHVFPIAQALFFIGLYSSGVQTNSAFMSTLKLEYGWTHRVCNQIKNDSHFIEHNIANPDGRWMVNKNKIKLFLNDILSRGNMYDRGADKIRLEIQNIGKTVNTWIDEQTEKIYQRCQSIIGRITPINENLWILSTISDLANDYEKSGFLSQNIPPVSPIASRGSFVPFTASELENTYIAWATYFMKTIQEYGPQYLKERLKRYTSEEKAFRSYKILQLMDTSIVSNVGQVIPALYQKIPDGQNKNVRFIEAFTYVLIRVLLNRIDQIFVDDPSPSITKLRLYLRTNFIDKIFELWSALNMTNLLREIDSLVENQLKGAGRKKRMIYRLKIGDL